MATISDAERAFYQQVLANPDGASISDLRYAYFLAGADGAIPFLDPEELADGNVPVWDANEGKWVPGSGGGGGGGGAWGGITGDIEDQADLQSALDAKVESPNSSISGIEYYATVEDLPATGTAGVIYFVDAV